MGENEILGKLRNTLYTSFSEECQVMYFLVEARKINCRSNNPNYPWIKFYRDWAVHISKDESTKEIREVMKKIYDEITSRNIENMTVRFNPVIPGFACMENLRKEINLFLQSNNLPDSLINIENWNKFVHTLTKILADQPITDAHPKIKSFSFVPDINDCISGVIEYQKEDGTFDVFPFGEVNHGE